MHKLLIASIVCLILSFACFAYGLKIYSAKQAAAKKKGHIYRMGTNEPARRILRKQPYVYLNTDVDIKPGTTLIVWSVSADTIVVY